MGIYRLQLQSGILNLRFRLAQLALDFSPAVELAQLATAVAPRAWQMRKVVRFFGIFESFTHQNFWLGQVFPGNSWRESKIVRTVFPYFIIFPSSEWRFQSSRFMIRLEPPEILSFWSSSAVCPGAPLVEFCQLAAPICTPC